MFGNLNKDTMILGAGAGLTAYAMFLAKGNKIFGIDKKMVTIAGVALLAFGGYTKFIKNKAPPMPPPMPLPAPNTAGPAPIAGMPTPISAGVAPIPIGSGGAGIPSGMPILPTNSDEMKSAQLGTMNGIGSLYNDLL